jgi:hypothetical protein
MQAQDPLNLTSSSTNSFRADPWHPPKNISSNTHFPQMLVPPYVNEAAAYASIRRDSVARPTKQHSSAKFIRQSFQRLSRFVDRQQSRGRAISHHPLRTSIVSSDTPTFESPPDWKLDARSIMTFGSSETRDNDASFSERGNATDEFSFRCVNAEKLPRFVGGKETELALSSTLQKIGVNIDQIDIHLKNGQRFSWRKRTGIIELPPALRKEIWRKAIVHDRKLLFAAACKYRTAHQTSRSSLTSHPQPLSSQWRRRHSAFSHPRISQHSCRDNTHILPREPLPAPAFSSWQQQRP